MIKIIHENIVLLGNDLNPGLYSEGWLRKVGAFGHKTEVKNVIFVPNTASVVTNEFELVALPDRLQFSFPAGISGDVVERVTTSILKNMGPTPFRAMGINFVWFFEPKDDKEYQQVNEAISMSESNTFSDLRGQRNQLNGFYVSFDYEGLRLKLDVKPKLKSEPGKKPIDVFSFEFNFHADFDAATVEPAALLAHMNKWTSFREYSNGIVTKGLKKWL